MLSLDFSVRPPSPKSPILMSMSICPKFSWVVKYCLEIRAKLRSSRSTTAFDPLSKSGLTKLFISGIILNLTVVISIREKESLMNNTVNVVLGNLCFANLIEAVFVKTIAVVYHGYAVARSRYNQGLYQKITNPWPKSLSLLFFACQIFCYLLPYTYSSFHYYMI